MSSFDCNYIDDFEIVDNYVSTEILVEDVVDESQEEPAQIEFEEDTEPFEAKEPETLPFITSKATEEILAQQHQQQPNKKKIGRNDPCSCGSGKKFKKCCFGKMVDTSIFRIGQSDSSPEVIQVVSHLSKCYPGFYFIDITNRLTAANYEQFHKANWGSKNVCIAQLTLANQSVFLSRQSRGDIDNIILMRNGHYRVFNHVESPYIELSLQYNIFKN